MDFLAININCFEAESGGGIGVVLCDRTSRKKLRLVHFSCVDSPCAPRETFLLAFVSVFVCGLCSVLWRNVRD